MRGRINFGLKQRGVSLLLVVTLFCQLTLVPHAQADAGKVEKVKHYIQTLLANPDDEYAWAGLTAILGLGVTLPIYGFYANQAGKIENGENLAEVGGGAGTNGDGPGAKYLSSPRAYKIKKCELWALRIALAATAAAGARTVYLILRSMWLGKNPIEIAKKGMKRENDAMEDAQFDRLVDKFVDRKALSPELAKKLKDDPTPEELAAQSQPKLLDEQLAKAVIPPPPGEPQGIPYNGQKPSAPAAKAHEEKDPRPIDAQLSKPKQRLQPSLEFFYADISHTILKAGGRRGGGIMTSIKNALYFKHVNPNIADLAPKQIEELNSRFAKMMTDEAVNKASRVALAEYLKHKKVADLKQHFTSMHKDQDATVRKDYLAEYYFTFFQTLFAESNAPGAAPYSVKDLDGALYSTIIREHLKQWDGHEK